MSGNPQAGMQAFMEGKVKVQGDLTKLMAAQVSGTGPGAPGPRRRALRDHGVTGAGASASARRLPGFPGSTNHAGSNARARRSDRDRLIGTRTRDAPPAGRSRSRAGTVRASRSRRARVATWILPDLLESTIGESCVSRPETRRSNRPRVTPRHDGQKNSVTFVPLLTIVPAAGSCARTTRPGR